MAFTKQEHEEILKKIAESGGATDDMLEDIQKLRDDYDERLGMESGSGNEWKTKYDELKKKYIDRFFAPPDEEAAAKEKEAAKKKQEKDVKKDGEEMTFDDLYNKKGE